MRVFRNILIALLVVSFSPLLCALQLEGEQLTCTQALVLHPDSWRFNSHIRIEILKRDRHEQTVAFIHRIFSYDSQNDLYKSFSSHLEWGLFQRETGLLKPDHYWIAIDDRDDSIVGSIGIASTREGDPESHWWVDWFGVHEQFRGQGLGRKLFSFALERARQMKIKYLNVYTGDIAEEATAQKLYDRAGFKEYEKFPNTTADGRKYNGILKRVELDPSERASAFTTPN